MRNGWKILTALMLVLMIQLPALSDNAVPRPMRGNQETPLKQSMEPSQDPHSVFWISYDQDFENLGLPGSGTEADPYIIEGYEINGGSYCINVQSTRAYFIIRDCVLRTSYASTNYAPVRFFNVSNGKIRDCVINSVGNGIRFDNTSDCRVARSHIIAEDDGVTISESRRCLVTNNDVNNGNRGIWFDESTECEAVINRIEKGGIRINDHYGPYDRSHWEHLLEDNEVNGRPIAGLYDLVNESIDASGFGQLFMFNCSNVSVTTGAFTNVTTAFELIGCTNCSVTQSSTMFTEDEGALLWSTNCSISSCVFNWSLRGTKIVNSSYCEVRGNVVGGRLPEASTFSYGFDFRYSSYCNCTENQVQDRATPFEVHDSDNIRVEGNSISFTGYGIHLTSSRNVTVVGNDFPATAGGFSSFASIRVYACRKISILGNNLSSPTNEVVEVEYSFEVNISGNIIHGLLEVRTTSDLTLDSNAVLSPVWGSIDVSYGCSNLSFVNNQFYNVSLSFSTSGYLCTAIEEIDNNTINGVPILVIAGEEDVDVSAEEFAQLFILDSNNVTVSNRSIEHVANAIVACNSTLIIKNMTSQYCSTFLSAGFSEFVLTNSSLVGTNSAILDIDSSSQCTISDCDLLSGTVSVYHCFDITISNCSILGRGVSVGYSKRILVQDCVISSNYNPLSFYDSNDSCIIGNRILDGEATSISWCRNLTLVDNELGPAWIAMQGYATEKGFWRHRIEGNTLLGVPIGYFCDVTDSEISYDGYSQFIVVLCNNTRVVGETSGPAYHVFIGPSQNVTLDGIKTGDYCHIESLFASNLAIRNCELGGYVYLEYSHDVHVSGCVFTPDSSLYTVLSNRPTVSNCTFDEVGLGFYGGYDALVSNCTFVSCPYAAIGLEYAWNATIEDCQIHGCFTGISSRGSDVFTITRNEIIDSLETGIEAISADWATVSNCLIEDSGQHAIHFWACAHSNITKNRIYGSGGVGVFLDGCENVSVWANGIGWNSGGNAYDEDGDICRWNFAIDGNFWSDYSGSGWYYIPGSTGSADSRPNLLFARDYSGPTVDHPADRMIWSGDAEVLTWSVQDENPVTYRVYLNGTLNATGSTETPMASVELDLTDWSPGNYILIIIVTDIFGDSATDTVVVDILQRQSVVSIFHWEFVLLAGGVAVGLVAVAVLIGKIQVRRGARTSVMR